MSDEKRSRTRIPFSTPAILSSPLGTISDARLRDISINGLFIDTVSRVPIGTPCEIAIVLKGRTSKLQVIVKGKVTREDETGLGIQFENDLEWWALFSIYGHYGRTKT